MAPRHTALIAVALLALAHPSRGQERSPIERVWQRVEVVMVTDQRTGQQHRPSAKPLQLHAAVLQRDVRRWCRATAAARTTGEISAVTRGEDRRVRPVCQLLGHVRHPRIAGEVLPSGLAQPEFHGRGGGRTDAFALDGDVLWLT